MMRKGLKSSHRKLSDLGKKRPVKKPGVSALTPTNRVRPVGKK